MIINLKTSKALGGRSLAVIGPSFLRGILELCTPGQVISFVSTTGTLTACIESTKPRSGMRSCAGHYPIACSLWCLPYSGLRFPRTIWLVLTEGDVDQACLGFTSNHILITASGWVFDYHGYSCREHFFTHTYRKADRWWPGWQATLVELPPDVFISESKSRSFNRPLAHPLGRRTLENVQEFQRNSGWSMSAFGHAHV